MRQSAQFKQKKPTQLPLLFHPYIDNGHREEGRKKINAVKCGDRKMSFWQMQGFVYAQIEFWWISPQARPPFLIYRPSYKNVKQWCYRKQIQMSLAQKVPMNLQFFVWGNFLKDRRRFKAPLYAYTAIFRRMLHKPCILICPVMEYLHWEINANEFALVQT